MDNNKIEKFEKVKEEDIMSATPSVKKNYIYSLLYQILTMITPFITAPYVARVLGADGVGIYSYTQSYMTYFTMIAALGTSSYGMREIAQCRNNKAQYSKKFWEIELLTVLTTLICLAFWIILVFYSDEYRSYFIALIPMLLATMFDISWFYTGHEKIGYTVFWNALCKIIGVICIYLFIKNKSDVAIYIFINAFIHLLGNVSMWIFLPKMLVKVNPKEFEIKKHFKETLVYFVPTVATTVYTVLDKTLIGAITQDSYQNGYYEQATKIVNMAKTAVFVSVNTVMSARISYLFSENRIKEIRARIEKSLDFILLLGFAVTFGIIAVAEDFVPIFFGKGYEPVIILLYWMSPLILIIGVSNCLGSQYYTPAGLRAQSSRYIIIGATINLVMNIILIPRFGAIGAIIGSIIAELTITFLYFKNCSGFLTIKQVLQCTHKRIVAGLVMVMIVKMIRHIGLNGITLLVCEILIGAFVYFLMLCILRDSMLKEAFIMVKRKVHRNG